MGADTFISSVEESLRKLQIESVDLLLIHWPDVSGKVGMENHLQKLAKVQRQGLSKAIGISNFNNVQLDQAIEILGADAILTN